MKLRPIHGKIIVRPQLAEAETSGGIIIANSKNEGVIQGEVVAVGPGEYDDKGNFVEPEVTPGTVILMNTSAGERFEFEKETYNTITSKEIIAVL